MPKLSKSGDLVLNRLARMVPTRKVSHLLETSRQLEESKKDDACMETVIADLLEGYVCLLLNDQSDIEGGSN